MHYHQRSSSYLTSSVAQPYCHHHHDRRHVSRGSRLAPPLRRFRLPRATFSVSHLRLRQDAPAAVATASPIERPDRAALPADAAQSPPSPQPRTAPAPAAVRAAPRAEGTMYSPAFASNGTALFYHTGRPSDARSALAEKTLGDDLEVMTILDDGQGIITCSRHPMVRGSRSILTATASAASMSPARDGSNVHRISGPGYAAIPTWSPDGQQLAFVRGEPNRPRVWNLWLTALATGETRRLTNFRDGQTWNASWFPDGKAVAYTHEDRLAVLNLADGHTRTFRSPLPGRLDADACGVARWTTRHLPGFAPRRLAGGSVGRIDARCVLTDPTAEEFAWSPDGRRVAFHSRRDGTWGVWIMATPRSAEGRSREV